MYPIEGCSYLIEILAFFLDEPFEVGHFEPASNNKGSPLMDAGRFNIHNPFASIECDSPSLLSKHSNWVSLIKQSKFAFRIVTCWRIKKNSPLQEGTVKICNHRSDVPGRIVHP